MPYKLIIREEAFEEMREAFLYYESVQLELGERFLSEIQKKFDELQVNPHLYGFIDINKRVRDVKIGHFPFQIVFEIIENKVIVLSVFNSNQNPSKLRIR